MISADRWPVSMWAERINVVRICDTEAIRSLWWWVNTNLEEKPNQQTSNGSEWKPIVCIRFHQRPLQWPSENWASPLRRQRLLCSVTGSQEFLCSSIWVSFFLFFLEGICFVSMGDGLSIEEVILPLWVCNLIVTCSVDMITEMDGSAKEKENSRGVINKAGWCSFSRTCILQYLGGSRLDMIWQNPELLGNSSHPTA